jgi:nicotinic acetylcholine receptor
VSLSLYHKLPQAVRPVENSSLPLIVEFGVSLHQIVDVDEKNQILTTNCWLTQVCSFHSYRVLSREKTGT